MEFIPDDRYRKFSNPIARLDMLLEDDKGDRFLSNCTANLIAPDVLLTNYHCIPGNDAKLKILKSIAIFDFLHEDQEQAPTYVVDITPIAADYSRDFALLRVQGRPGDRFGYFKLKPEIVKPNQSLFILHHPV